MAHTTEVTIKKTAKSTTYIYKVDGKVVRTSVRQYIVSTANGSYFSSRMDLLQKNTEYQLDFQSASHRANLTESQHAEEQEATLLRYKKNFAEYSDTKSREEWVNHMVEINYHFGNKPTQKELDDSRDEAEKSWSKWLAQAKANYDKQIALMNDPEAMKQDLNETRERGKVRLQALELVTYKF